MSAEFSGDIEESLRLASNLVEDKINAVIEAKDYDIELESWDCIAIIMKDESDFTEVVKYSKKKRDMDFRLRVRFEDFIDTDELGRQSLLYQMLQRSLDLLIEKGANTSGISVLRADVERTANENAWSAH